MSFKVSISLIVLFLLMTTISFAQKKYSYFSVGGQIGTSHYQGDLDDHGFELWRGGGNAISARLFRPSFGFQANYHFNPHLFVRLQFNQGWIGAADSLNSDEGEVGGRHYRNLHFKSSLSEVSFQFVYEFFATDRHYKYRPVWTPYVFTGLALFHFNPKAQPNKDWVDRYPMIFDDYEEWVELSPLGTQGQNLPDVLREENDLPDPYALTQFSIPMGIGIRYMLAEKWDLRCDVSLRKTFTDYIDDVSGAYYAPPDELLRYEGEKTFLFADRSGYANFGVNRSGGGAGQEISARQAFNGAYGEQEMRGNNNDKDWYGFISIGVTYIIDRGDRCPKHRPFY